MRRPIVSLTRVRPSLRADDIAHLSGELDLASKLLEATAQEYPLRLVPGSRTPINLRWNLGADEVFSAAVRRRHSNHLPHARARRSAHSLPGASHPS